MTIRRRLAMVSAVAVAVAVVAVAGASYFVARQELLAEVDASLVERIEIVARASGDLRPSFRQQLAPRPFFGPPEGRPSFDTLFYQLTLPDGSSIVPPDQELTLPPPGPVGRAPVISDQRIDGIHVRIAAADIPSLGIVQIARPLDEVDATLAGLGLVLAGVGLVGTIGAGVVGLWVARSTLRPIDELTDAAEHVAATQDLDARIEVDRGDELGRLARAFNTMLSALESSREQQRRLVRDAGHELKTPLTALRANIELLAKAEDLPADERAALVASLEAEVVELANLVGEVVDVASDRYADEPVESIDLGELAAEAAERWSRRTGRAISVRTEAAEVIEGRRAALRRALDNLLDNADKWSPAEAPIVIDVDGARVTVVDRGPGISPADRSRVFDRFYRSAEARRLPGSGLGLSIVRQIVEDHGGSVFVSDVPDGGAAVGFDLATTAT